MDPSMIDPPNHLETADHCRITPLAPDGAARRYEVPVAWAYDAAKHTVPGKDCRLDGQPVMFSGLADGSLFASHEQGATRTLSPR
jgi:hypothetical protein